MPRKIEKKERGVFEKEPGSDIWWIRYYIDGRERREKVGRRGDAIKLYKLRKTDALRGVKLPTNMKHKGLRFKVIAQEAIDWYIEHGRKDVKSFRIRMNIILKDFGERVADDIKPSDIDAWLSDHKCAPATKNRYKNVFGRTFKNALADGKVTSNPARLVEQRPESNGRIQFLSDEEETILHEAIKRRCPDHMEEFDIALNTGMRKSEQYTTEWPQISFNRKRVKLEGTKNGSDREIPMNKTCMSAYDALCRRRRNQQLHLTLPSAHVHQSSGYERRGPPDRAGIGWSQDDLHDRPVCPCRTRTQSGRGRKAGFCSCLSADLWKMPNWLDDLELSRSVGSHFSAVESVIQPNVQDGLNGRIASDQT